MKSLSLLFSTIIFTFLFASNAQGQNDSLYDFSQAAKEFRVAAVKVEGTRFPTPIF